MSKGAGGPAPTGERNWFILADDDMAIVAKKNGTLHLMPFPVFNEDGQERDSVAIGSENGKRTFAPGTSLGLLLRLSSAGAVQTHKELPPDLRAKIGSAYNRAYLVARTEILQLLEDNLTPKQKETDNDRDG